MNNTFMGSAEYVDIVMQMCGLLEYGGNYSMTSGGLWNYYRDEMNENVNDGVNENNDDYYR